MRRWLPALMLTAAPMTAAAAEDQFCRNGLFPSDPPFRAATVTGKGRAWFQDDMDGCPGEASSQGGKASSTGGRACRSRSFVLPGQTVFVSRSHGEWLCAFFPSKGGGTAGWIEARRLSVMPPPVDPPLFAWTGTWSSDGNPLVRIRLERGALQIEGEAFWPGREIDPESPYRSVHIGEILGPLRVSGNLARYEDDDLCEVRFTLLGETLIAGDNHKCGGMNVSFSGVYAKHAR